MRKMKKGLPVKTISEGQPVSQDKQPHNIFDLIFKRLMHASKIAIISFINGLFNANHSLDEELVYLSTETITDGLGRIISDIIVAVGTKTYLIEAQIENDGNMAVRIFQYVYADALKRKKADKDGSITITFPTAKVLYWEPTGSTPDKTTLHLKFPSGNTEDYVVESFKYLNYSIAQLEEHKMSILLPFYVLKLREKVKQAETSEERQRLSEELKGIVLELETIIAHSEKEGILTADRRLMQDFMARLTDYLYDKYSEFREVRKMMQDTLLTYAEEAALKEREAMMAYAGAAVQREREAMMTYAEEAAIAAAQREREAMMTYAEEAAIAAVQKEREAMMTYAEEAVQREREVMMTYAEEAAMGERRKERIRRAGTKVKILILVSAPLNCVVTRTV